MLYFAPLEGITTCTYRNTHQQVFGGCDAYFAPFITPSDNEKITRKGLRDIVPEHNAGMNLKVQVLTNQSASFLKFARKIQSVGFQEVNINLGCPFPRVVGKGRGAGFLRETEILNRFFDEIFSKTDMKISVKTRTGFYSGDEMGKLMEIYNQYPLSLLIIHPRAREDFYKGEPNQAVFAEAYQQSKSPVCYNGNVFSKEDYQVVTKKYPALDGVMIGRGAIQNPAIFREIRGGARLTTQELIVFSKKLAENYYEVLESTVFTLQKLKEIWAHIMLNFPEEGKIAKAIKKANKISDFMAAIQYLPELNQSGCKEL